MSKRIPAAVTAVLAAGALAVPATGVAKTHPAKTTSPTTKVCKAHKHYGKHTGATKGKKTGSSRGKKCGQVPASA